MGMFRLGLKLAKSEAHTEIWPLVVDMQHSKFYFFPIRMPFSISNDKRLIGSA